MADTRLGDNLKKAREAAGWSREELGVHSGTSGSAVARTELYGAVPRLGTIYAWAAALGVAATELLPAALAPVSTPGEPKAVNG